MSDHEFRVLERRALLTEDPTDLARIIETLASRQAYQTVVRVLEAKKIDVLTTVTEFNQIPQVGSVGAELTVKAESNLKLPENARALVPLEFRLYDGPGEAGMVDAKGKPLAIYSVQFTLQQDKVNPPTAKVVGGMNGDARSVLQGIHIDDVFHIRANFNVPDRDGWRRLRLLPVITLWTPTIDDRLFVWGRKD